MMAFSILLLIIYFVVVIFALRMVIGRPVLRKFPNAEGRFKSPELVVALLVILDVAGDEVDLEVDKLGLRLKVQLMRIALLIGGGMTIANFVVFVRYF